MALVPSATLSTSDSFLLLGASLPAEAALLIGFEDTSPGTALYLNISDSQMWLAQWTQSVATHGTSVSAIVHTNVGPASGTAFLTTAIRPGTTVADEIARASFEAPTVATPSDLSGAPYTQLFSGLSLDPGTYYLILQGQSRNSYQWLGDFTGVAVHTAPGFSLGDYRFTAAVAPYPPASRFPHVGDPNQFGFYRVESSPVPEPTSLLLLGAGLLGIATRRLRNR